MGVRRPHTSPLQLYKGNKLQKSAVRYPPPPFFFTPQISISLEKQVGERLTGFRTEPLQ